MSALRFSDFLGLKEPVEEDESLPAKKANAIFEKYPFSIYLPIVSKELESDVYRCQGQNETTDEYAVVYEIRPRVTMGSKTAEFMQELIEKLPIGMFLQVHYIGSKNINKEILRFKDFHNNDNGIFQKAMKNYIEFLDKKTKENITPSFNAYIKAPRVLISARGRDMQKVKEFGSAIFNTAHSNMFFPAACDPDELKIIFYELCNGDIDFSKVPKYVDNIAFGRQCISKSTKIRAHDDSLEINGKHWIALAPVSLPSEACIDDFGLKLGDYLSPSSNLNQFRDTFVITATYKRLAKAETSKIASKQMAIHAQKLPELFTRLVKRREEAKPIKEKLDDRKPCLLFDLTILVSGKDKKDADSNATTVQSFWNKGGENASQIILDRLFSVHHIAFLQSLPGGATDEHLKVTDNFAYNFSDEVAQFLPLEADWQGNTPNIVAFSRRGHISAFDLFDSPNGKNGYVVATSGAGKSVLLQNLTLYNYGCNTTNYIIDIGGSYERICRILHGEYIEVDLENPISFNPFSQIKTDDDLNRSLPFLEDFIYMLGASKNVAESEKDEKYIKGFITVHLKELYLKFGSELEITHVRDQFMKQDDERQKTFATHLTSFCKGGVYGAFFEGVATVSLKNPYTVLELGKVEEMSDIRDAIIFVMVFHITQNVYVKNDFYQRIQVIIDEAHKFLGKNPKMDSFIDQAYRRFRKHNGSIIIATQGFDDIYNATTGGLSKAGQTIIANSAWKIFLKQTQTSVNLLVGAGVFKFTHTEEQLIHSISTLKGEYSEFLLITPQEYKIPYRLVLDKFFYYLTTTDPVDKAKIAETIKKYDCTIEDAIEILINFEGNK